MIDTLQNKRIEFSPIFNKLITRAPTEIKIAFREALDLFAENPTHPALRNHPLTGKYAGFQSNEASPQQAVGYQTEGHCRGDTTVSPPSSLCKVTSQQAPRNLLIDVTEDWRALYREEPERIKFVALGTHEQLYE